MTSIIPVPSSRVSDLFAQQRLLSQLMRDEIAMVRIQTQISTGRRILLPSEDAPAALRGTALQQLLERKNQVHVNLETNRSFLSATDSALSSISNMFTSIRSTALGVMDSTSSETQREAAAAEVNRTLQQLLDAGNQNFRGRYLFAGSQTAVRPFETVDDHVLYNGNQGSLASYSDIDLLFATNAHGNAVFGAISQPVQGSVDLNPVVSAGTRLADLRGGQGITPGSVAISDGINVSIVDVSRAETLGDVAAMLETAFSEMPALVPPRKVTVTITNTGLNVLMNTDGGGILTVTEVGGGATAHELGIFQETAAPAGPYPDTALVAGSDLNPRLTRTTLLSDILGTRASVNIVSGGTDNDIRIDAINNGAANNGVTVSFVHNPMILPGAETVSLVGANLTFQISSGNTRAVDIVNCLNNDPVAGLVFRAAHIRSDASTLAAMGSGAVAVTATGVTAGGSGINLDKTSGIQLINGEQTYAIDFATANTIEDLLNEINNTAEGVLAEINQDATGINVRSRLSGADLMIGENGGTTATELGIRSFTAATRLDDLNHGLGVRTLDENGVTNRGFTIRRRSGMLMNVDLSTANTIGDVINLINTHPQNGGNVTAQLKAVGNGIELVTSEAGLESFAVLEWNNSDAAVDLGLIPEGEEISDPAAVVGPNQVISGRDANPQEVDGAFNALIRLSRALMENDYLEIKRAVEQLDAANINLNLNRAEIGARQQGLDVLQSRLDEEVISLEDSLSKEIDVDLAEAISNLTARQAAFQASLQTAASISRLTLLDFL